MKQERQRFTDTESGRLGFRVVQSVCVALTLAGSLAALMAEPLAVIRNRALTVGGGKEVDAAVKILAIDSLPIVDGKSKIAVAPGEHAIKEIGRAHV